ncbi:MAG TPA: flavodoxin family protein [Armatimonadetes bacterium]|nr:flavodoxin family protein [Armatimonadota bacterium]
MARMLIVYFSKTGNTKAMAEAIAEGAKEAGAEVIVKTAEEARPSELVDADVIVLGSPAYFGNMAWPLKRFVDESIEVYGKLRGKHGGCFSSGGGVRDAERTVTALTWALEIHGLKVEKGIAIAGSPSGEERERLKEYGRKLAGK